MVNLRIRISVSEMEGCLNFCLPSPSWPSEITPIRTDFRLPEYTWSMMNQLRHAIHECVPPYPSPRKQKAQNAAMRARSPRAACDFCHNKRVKCVTLQGQPRCEQCTQRDTDCIFSLKVLCCTVLYCTVVLVVLFQHLSGFFSLLHFSEILLFFFSLKSLHFWPLSARFPPVSFLVSRYFLSASLLFIIRFAYLVGRSFWVANFVRSA